GGCASRYTRIAIVAGPVGAGAAKRAHGQSRVQRRVVRYDLRCRSEAVARGGGLAGGSIQTRGGARVERYRALEARGRGVVRCVFDHKKSFAHRGSRRLPTGESSGKLYRRRSLSSGRGGTSLGRRTRGG